MEICVLVNTPELYLELMHRLTELEKKGMSANKALKCLGKDLKTAKRFQHIYRLSVINEQSYEQVLVQAGTLHINNCATKGGIMAKIYFSA